MILLFLLKNMNIKNTQTYDHIYWVQNPEKLSDRDMEKLVMVDSKNYNFFLSEIDGMGVDADEMKNISLVEFDEEKDMYQYLESMDRRFLIGFSREHDVPCLLCTAI